MSNTYVTKISFYMSTKAVYWQKKVEECVEKLTGKRQNHFMETNMNENSFPLLAR
jgi:gluconate kinase